MSEGFNSSPKTNYIPTFKKVLPRHSFQNCLRVLFSFILITHVVAITVLAASSDYDDINGNNNCPTGSITFERWTGISGSAVTDLTGNANYPNSPSETGTFSSFQGPTDIAESYGTRVRGFLHPNESGSFIFTVTADDGAEVYLSTDEDPLNKVKIAEIIGWTGPTEFTKYPSQTSSSISLIGGQKYYVELIHKEGGGGDHLALYWQTPSNSTRTVIQGNYLSPWECTEVCGNGTDDDGDGLVDCADSDCPEVCESLVCDDGVTLLSKAENIATGQGASGIPSISNITIPNGNNRMVFIVASFEREHCQSGDNCTNSNSTGTGLGDNFAAPNFLAGNPQITVRLTGSDGTLDKQNPLTFPDGDLRFAYQTGFPDPPGTNSASFFSRESYFIAIYESDIQFLLNGNSSGSLTVSLQDVTTPIDEADDAILTGFVFSNVKQAADGIVRSGVNTGDNFINSGSGGTTGDFIISDSNLDNGQEPDEPQDALLVIGVSGLGSANDGGFLTTSGYTEISELKTSNSNGHYLIYNEGDGFSQSVQITSGPNSGTIDNTSIQSSGNSGLTANGGYLAAFTIESCEEICDNIVDNDGDGLLDHNDVDCCAYPTDIITQAEDVSLNGGVVATTNNAGYNSSGFVDYPSSTGSNVNLTWTENVSVAGSYYMSIRYALGSGTRSLNLYVNGNLAATYSFNATGSWSSWATETHYISVSAGVNSFVLAADAGTVGPNVDEMTLRVCGIEVCGNGIDDNGNGQIDEYDIECYECLSGLLTNNDFQNDLTGWTDWGNTSVLTEGVNKTVEVSLGQGGIGQDIAASAGQEFILTFYGRRTGLDFAIAGLKFYDASWTQLGNDHVNSVYSSEFRQHSITATAPTNTAWVQTFVWKGVGSGSVFYDNMCLTYSDPSEICYNGSDDDGDGLVDCADEDCLGCPVYNPFPGFPIDFQESNCSWIDYDLSNDMMIQDNGNGTLTLTGLLDNAIDADWDACVSNPCGNDDSWILNLTLSDEMDWTTFQTSGGTALVNSSCSGNGLQYWLASGTLTGVGCNSGRTITVNGVKSPHRLQIGYGGNSNDGTCVYGLSAWFELQEGANVFSADIYGFLNPDCFNEYCPEEICGNNQDDDNDGLIDAADPDCFTYTNDYCVTPNGSTGFLHLGDMPTSDVSGAGTYNYLDRTIPGYGTVDISIVTTGGIHKSDTTASQGAKQTSWLNEGLPSVDNNAIYLGPNGGGNAIVTYSFDQPTGNIDLLMLDLDSDDVVTITAKNALGDNITDFSGWRYVSGDMSTWDNPNPIASPPSWNSTTGTLTSTDSGNDHRSFGLLTPDVLVTEVVISFNATQSGRHVYTSIFSTSLGRDGETCSPEVCNNGIDDDGDGLTDNSDPDCIDCNVDCSNSYTFNWYDGTSENQWLASNGESALTRVYSINGGIGAYNVSVTLNNPNGQNIDMANCGTAGSHFYTATCNDPNAGFDCDNDSQTTDSQFNYGCGYLTFGMTSNTSDDIVSITYSFDHPSQICGLTIADIDYQGSGYPDVESWQDEVDVVADSMGVPVNLVAEAGSAVTIINNNTPNLNLVAGYDNTTGGNLSPDDAAGQAEIYTLGKVTSITFTYSNGPSDEGQSNDHAIRISGFQFCPNPYEICTDLNDNDGDGDIDCDDSDCLGGYDVSGEIAQSFLECQTNNPANIQSISEARDTLSQICQILTNA